ncbi:hypothetical protein VC83_07008 [Pseudogymnoascus destructans]|uniref:Uncharacterized protein n=1 Tax=Pseudogymnoascus destructans TaxID=655981 RepID=A0A177A3C2_9PEZI|nr:uncharacterized protein VC83_07008 [Pseudogymnoascus destructans]OAF56765.1 hypothetical protein VC83_07008 [Pseudogymnoascus destructans]
MPARMPGRRPVMMAVVGKRGQVAGMEVGLTLRGEMVVEVSLAEVESVGSVEVEDGDVDDAGGEVGGGMMGGGASGLSSGHRSLFCQCRSRRSRRGSSGRRIRAEYRLDPWS